MYTHSSLDPQHRCYIFTDPKDAWAFAKLFDGCAYFGRYVFL